MKVLVATNQLHDPHHGDYAHTVEGELVLVEVAECDDPQRCGCGRGWPGMASRKATTTAMIVEHDHLSEDDLRQAITDWLEASGWTDLFRDAAEVDDGFTDAFQNIDEMLEAMVDEHVESIAMVCDAFPVGTVLERRGTIVQARAWPAAA